jgi:predicted nucleic-acid-binding protein
MIAVDTNVLVRVITNDDSDQAPLAARLLNRHDRVFISKTVLLELEWVLRSAYKIGAGHILKALIQFRDRPNVEIEDEAAVGDALGWFEQGMDFADALHLASTGRECPLATFDAALVRKASQLGLKAVAVA